MGDIDDADRAILSFYTGHGAQAINSLLRGRSAESPELRLRIAALDVAVGKGRLTEDAILYRGVDAIGERLLVRNGIREGTVLSDPAFLSTSRDPEIAMRFAALDTPNPNGGLIMLIEAHAGGVGLDVARYSNAPDEREVIVPRDARLLIHGYDAELRTLMVEIVE